MKLKAEHKIGELLFFACQQNQGETVDGQIRWQSGTYYGCR